MTNQSKSHSVNNRQQANTAKTKQRFVTTLLTTSALASGGLSSGSAQEIDAQADTGIEEIVVYGKARRYRPDDQTTATGLRMKLIDTPQSMSILTSEMLEISASRTVYDAVDMVPGVERSGEGFGLQYLVVRGQRLNNGRVNGTEYPTFTYPDSFALERVEIVRGPATVLYGVTGAFGGEVNSILKTPQPDTRIQFGVEAGEWDMQRYELDVTGSIPNTNDRLQARLVGAYKFYDDYVETVDNENEDQLLLGSVDYEFTPKTVGRVSYFYQNIEADPMDGCTLVWNGGPNLSLPDFVPADNYYCGFNEQSWMRTQNGYAMASIEHTFANDWTIHGRGSYTDYDWEGSYFFPFGPTGAYYLNDNEVYLYTYDIDSKGEELTFNLSLGGDFDAFGREHSFFAAFEYRDNPDLNRRAFLQSVGVGFFDIRDGGSGVLADGSPIPLVDRSTLPLASEQFSSAEEFLGSLQLLLKPSDKLELLAGGLVQNSEIFGMNGLTGNSLESDFTEFVPRFGITYDFVDEAGWISDARVYYSYSEGFQPNIGIFDENGNPLDDPQEMTSNEIGIKTELIDENVSASIAYFDSELTNEPVFIILPGMIAQSVSRLEGRRTYEGVEVEIVGEILPGWNMAFNYGWTDAKIDDPGNPDLELLVRAQPENQAALYTSYEFLAGPLRGLRLGGAVVYKDDYPFVDDFPRLVRLYGQLIDSGYTRFDLNASYTGFRGALEGLEIYANVYNANDVDYFIAREGHPGFSVNRGYPRQITAGFRYTFQGK